MLDTSVVERKIRGQVLDMTFKAIVTEAFVGGLPINESELDEGLTQKFVGYANECLEDLGGYHLLEQAIENTVDPIKKARLRRMSAVCMEAAQEVTARILKENAGDDKALIEGAKNVALTPEEYARFSKNAATLTPDSLSKMIQKKTLAVIKEEKEAYKKDAELETELKNALNEAEDDEDDSENAISTELSPEDKSEAEGKNENDDVNAMQAGNNDATGADIGQSSNSPSVAELMEDETPSAESYIYMPANESILSRIKEKLTRKHGTGNLSPETAKAAVDKWARDKGLKPVDSQDVIENLYRTMMDGATPNLQKSPDGFYYDVELYKDAVVFAAFDKDKKAGLYLLSGEDLSEKGASESDTDTSCSKFTKMQEEIKKDPEQQITGMLIGMACPCPKHQAEEASKDPVKKAVDHTASTQVAQQGMAPNTGAPQTTNDDPGQLGMDPEKGVPQKANDEPGQTGMESASGFDSYMRALAGKNYRAKHASIFSRIQELAYESMLGTTESYENIPFKTMADITKHDTFEVFGSHWNAGFEQMVDSIGLYNFGIAQEGFFDRWKKTGRKEAKQMNDEELAVAFIAAMKDSGLNLSGDTKALKAAMVESEKADPTIQRRYTTIDGVAVVLEHSDMGFDVIYMVGNKTVWKTRPQMIGIVGNYLDKKTKEDRKAAKQAPATESEATPDQPNAEEDILNNSLLVASIIYTFFETLNTMNLYCPKLAEIRRFVDETIPVQNRIALDANAFKSFLQELVSSAKTQLLKADTTQEVDAMQKNFDIVRERMSAPGFESIRDSVNKAVESIQSAIDQRRDKIVSSQRPVQTAVESYSDTLKRERDVMKFDRATNLLGRKPNVVSLRCKVDPQGHSKYVAIEAFDAKHSVAGKTTIVLESALASDVVDYVTGTIKASKMSAMTKPVIMTDARSGKIYFDSTKN